MGLIFSVHKTDKKMDRMGTGQKELFHKIPFSEILNFVRWELFENHLFVVSDRVLSQKRGVAIGGALSAQLPSLYCMIQALQCLAVQTTPPNATLHITPHATM